MELQKSHMAPTLCGDTLSFIFVSSLIELPKVCKTSKNMRNLSHI